MEELKRIEEFLERDFRSSCRGFTLEVLHELASQHELSTAAPENVQHQFEVARHAYVYSALYTPLCAAAEFYAILAVEHALRLKYSATHGENEERMPRGLRQLLRLAIDERWIRDDGFDFDFREQVFTETGIEYRPIPVAERRRPTDVVLEVLPTVRNELAHGRPTMALETVGLHLQRATEIINQLFPSEEPGGANPSSSVGGLGMEWLLILLILGALLWAFASKGRERSSRSTRSDLVQDDDAEDLSAKQRALEANRAWLDERWRMAESERTAGELKHFPRWFFDEPTDRQRGRLQRDGVKVSGSATKGQLSDIIGLFVEPEADELERLKFHGISLKGPLCNETRARHEIAKAEADPEKARAWLMRPATAMQKEFFRFIGEKPPAGLTAEQAEAKKRTTLDAMTDERADEWFEFENLVDAFSDSEFRAELEIKKPTSGDIRAAMLALKGEGKAVDDPYDVAEKLLDMKPSLERTSKN